MEITVHCTKKSASTLTCEWKHARSLHLAYETLESLHRKTCETKMFQAGRGILVILAAITESSSKGQSCDNASGAPDYISAWYG